MAVRAGNGRQWWAPLSDQAGMTCHLAMCAHVQPSACCVAPDSSWDMSDNSSDFGQIKSVADEVAAHPAPAGTSTSTSTTSLLAGHHTSRHQHQHHILAGRAPGTQAGLPRVAARARGRTHGDIYR